MYIQNFKDLSSFIYEEYENMSEAFGISTMPKKSLRFVERQIRRYCKLYRKPLYLKAKRQLEIDIAFDTMPHGWLWKLWNNKLWKKMQAIIKEREAAEREVELISEIDAEQQEVKETLVPAIITNLEDREVDIVDEGKFDDNFD